MCLVSVSMVFSLAQILKYIYFKTSLRIIASVYYDMCSIEDIVRSEMFKTV